MAAALRITTMRSSIRGLQLPLLSYRYGRLKPYGPSPSAPPSIGTSPRRPLPPAKAK
ncbi:hypothetical protein L211DRAFT_842090, partial [Terfezia boudieri ATCC MYA-4762]